MTGRSISRAVIAAALLSVAAMPAVAQDDYPPPAQSGQGYQGSDNDRGNADDGGQAANQGGFASRDAIPPDSSSPSPPPEDEDTVGSTWHAPPPSGEAATAEDDSLDANPRPAPGTINSFDQPEATPGFQAGAGIDNRDQAVSACLAAVRARVGGGAGAARVDGIRGEWMVSGAVADGRAFYCAIHNGAIDDIEFGG